MCGTRNYSAVLFLIFFLMLCVTFLKRKRLVVIESITLVDFQRHDKLKINLDPHVTFLTGETDAGKSTVLRALRWLCLNSGTGYNRRGADRCIVSIVVDGKKISRKRSKSGNTYTLDDKRYDAVRSNVPEAIENILRVSEDSFQRQIALPYWFCLSPGQVSKELNAIVRLDVIDTSLSRIGSEARDAKSELTVAEQRLKSLQDSLEKLKYTEQLDSELKRLEERSLNLDRKRSKIAQDAKTLESAEDAIGRRDCLSQLHSDVAGDLKRGIEKTQRLKELQSKIERMESLIEGVERKEAELCRVKSSLESTELQLANLGNTCPLCGSLLSRPGKE